MRVYVTGASGFIGSAVVAQLLAAGHAVVAMTRSDAGATRVRELGAEVHRADLSDPDQVAAGAARTDAAIHLAYGHGESPADAVSADAAVIASIGATYAGSDRALAVTSGTLVLPPGRLGTEADRADPTAAAGARGANEQVALDLADRGVRVSVVRLAPCVHDRVRRGFVGGLIDAARQAGVAGYVGDGSQRWPAVHREDAAQLFRLAIETAPAGSVLHGVADEGVAIRTLAEVIGSHLHLPTREISREQASSVFGWLADLVDTDAPASSAATRRTLGWRPTHLGLLDDLERGDFFAPAPR